MVAWRIISYGAMSESISIDTIRSEVFKHFSHNAFPG
ncbi:unnamed protein product, partial [marine sediment metagenome]